MRAPTIINVEPRAISLKIRIDRSADVTPFEPADKEVQLVGRGDSSGPASAFRHQLYCAVHPIERSKTVLNRPSGTKVGLADVSHLYAYSKEERAAFQLRTDQLERSSKC